MLISVVIPARNEAENIQPTLVALEKSIRALPHETLVINDHSTDRTFGKVIELQRDFPSVRSIDNIADPGFASALWTGFRNAAGEGIVVVMADACDDPDTIPLMARQFQQGYDLVCGARYRKNGGKEGGPKVQGVFSFLVNLVLHVLYRMPTADATNAFKLYRRDLLLKLRPREKGFAVSLELALLFWKSGCRIKDVPTFWRGRVKGQSKFRINRAVLAYSRQLWYALR